MFVSHDIRLNTAIKDINELKFNQSKILSENLTIPGFVGPSCDIPFSFFVFSLKLFLFRNKDIFI